MLGYEVSWLCTSVSLPVCGLDRDLQFLGTYFVFYFELYFEFYFELYFVLYFELCYVERLCDPLRF